MKKDDVFYMDNSKLHDDFPHQFSEEYERKFRKNLVKHFGEKDAEDILKIREETKRNLTDVC